MNDNYELDDTNIQKDIVCSDLFSLAENLKKDEETNSFVKFLNNIAQTIRNI